MHATDQLDTFRGVWTFTAYDGQRECDDRGRVLNPIVWQQTAENLIVTTGKHLILDRIFGLAGVNAIAGCAVGTSGSTAAVGDTSITGAAYKAFASTPTRAGLTVTCLTSFGTSEANINIQEAGLLTGAGGTLLNRLAPIGPFNKTSAVSLDVQIQITQS